MADLSTICVCGHAEGYHDAHTLGTPAVEGLCSIWSCYCTAYERADDGK